MPPGPEVIFTNWREVLNLAPLPHTLREGYIRAIEVYLDYCRRTGLSVTKESARDCMADVVRRKLAANAVQPDGTSMFTGTPPPLDLWA